MTIFFGKQKKENFLPGQGSRGPTTGFFENLGAAFDATRLIDLSDSRSEALDRAVVERRAIIEEIAGKKFDEVIPLRFAPRGLGGPGNVERRKREDIAVAEFAASLPEDQRDKILTGDELVARGNELTLEELDRAQNIQSRARAGQATGQFLGSLGGFVTDPINIAVLPVGLQLTAARGILATALVETSIGAGAEIAIQPFVQGFRKDLGLPHGFTQALANIATGALGAGAFAGGVKAIGRGLGLGRGFFEGRKLLKEAEARRADLDAEAEAALDILKRENEIQANNPIETAPDRRSQHAKNFRDAQEAMQDGKVAPDIDARTPREDIKPRDTLGEADPGPKKITEGIFVFDPDDLHLDPNTFQFKTNIDQNGITDSLKGVKKWRPERANMIIVWQRADGKYFVGNGHSRTSLAKSIKSADPAQDPRLVGYVFREADGVSAADVRAISAAANIAEGNATLLDAAKILRDAPELGVDLPGSTRFIRRARGLQVLSNDAFGMVINDIVPARFAAILGRIAPGAPDAHAQVLKILARNKPANLIEAESIIRDALEAPRVKNTQSTLFGDVEETQILFKERAEILAAASRALADDKRVFKILNTERSRIEGEGKNVLDKAANKKRAQASEEILKIIQILARRKGPVADALNEASQALKSGGRKSEVVRRFIDEVAGRATEIRGSRRVSGGRRGDLPGGTERRAAPGGRERVNQPDAPEQRPDPSKENPAPRPEKDDGLKDFDAAVAARRKELIEEGFDEPAGDAQARQGDQLLEDIRNIIDDEGDFDVAVGDDGVQKASDLLDEIEADTKFLDDLDECNS